MKTIISHFYNEEYLLPWWLNHHKQFFDHGIMINYHSTDSSVSLIKDICPNWDIINTRNEFFDAAKIDEEIYDIEQQIVGWRIVLNTTEFLIGNYVKLNNYSSNHLFIPSFTMIDSIENENLDIDYNTPLIKQRFYGANFDPRWPNDGRPRQRKLLNYREKLTLGRHYDSHLVNQDFIILWYGYAPFNKYLINRKLQIQNKIPQTDKNRGLGWQHIIDTNQIKNNFYKLQSYRIDLSSMINKYSYEVN